VEAQNNATPAPPTNEANEEETTTNPPAPSSSSSTSSSSSSSTLGECNPADGTCVEELDGAVRVHDDLDSLLQVLPADVRDKLLTHPERANLLEVVLDLGRQPEARFQGSLTEARTTVEVLRQRPVDWEDLQSAEEAVGQFGGDNRAGIEGTLHRISALRNRRGVIVGLTCRVGRAVTGHIDMIRDMIDSTESSRSILFLGRPGVGKTTVIREIARVLADECGKRVVVVDTSNEIGGDGDIPHPAIGRARRMQVPEPGMQHRVMIEAVENHMPQVVIVDEIGTEAEALACRTIAERGVMLVGTAHGRLLENVVKNPSLSDLIGGVHTVTLSDEEARNRGTQKSVLERKGPATFPCLIEMRDRTHWVEHDVEMSVDFILQGRVPTANDRRRVMRDGTAEVVIRAVPYSEDEEERGGDSMDKVAESLLSGAGSGWEDDLTRRGGRDNVGLPSMASSTSSSSSSSSSSPSSSAALGGGDQASYGWSQGMTDGMPDTDALQELAILGLTGPKKTKKKKRN